MPFTNPNFPGRVFNSVADLRSALSRLDKCGKPREQIVKEERIMKVKEKLDDIKMKKDYQEVKLIAEFKTTSEYLRNIVNILHDNSKILQKIGDKLDSLITHIGHIGERL